MKDLKTLHVIELSQKESILVEGGFTIIDIIEIFCPDWLHALEAL